MPCRQSKGVARAGFAPISCDPRANAWLSDLDFIEAQLRNYAPTVEVFATCADDLDWIGASSLSRREKAVNSLGVLMNALQKRREELREARSGLERQATIRRIDLQLSIFRSSLDALTR